ncbi:MFS transporter, partial [Vitellibacter sp. q18]|nr:MFS transporter [Aequorivita lutea]
QVTEQQAAWMSSVFSVFYACGFLLFAPLSQKFGNKQIIVFGLLVLACFTFLTALPQAYDTVLAFRALQGLFAATCAPTALGYVFDLFPDHWRIAVI